MSRANPFGDLDDFAPQGAPKPVPTAVIEEIAKASGFPSRKASAAGEPQNADDTSASKPSAKAASTQALPPAPVPVRTPRRRTTGRNRQINIKATEETIAELYRVADELDLPLGAVLERALEALVAETS